MVNIIMMEEKKGRNQPRNRKKRKEIVQTIYHKAKNKKPNQTKGEEKKNPDRELRNPAPKAWVGRNKRKGEKRGREDGKGKGRNKSVGQVGSYRTTRIYPVLSMPYHTISRETSQTKQ
jgi:hypothetical protein